MHVAILQKNQLCFTLARGCILFFALAMTILLGTGCERKQPGIKGKIMNAEVFDLNDAFIQIVPSNKGEDGNGQEVQAMYGIDGNLFGVEYSSDLPKVDMQENATFVYPTETLAPGKYIIAVQNLMPKEKPVGYFGPGPLLIRPLASREGKVIFLEITESAKQPYSLDLGSLYIAFEETEKFVVTEFETVSTVSIK